VVTFHLFALIILFSLPPPVAARIETAFLENSPAVLRDLLAAEGTIPVSLPEPLSLADQLSPDQAFLVFREFFSIFKTTEFTANPQVFSLPGSPGGILKARWSFRNRRTGRQYPFRLYFFIAPVRLPRAPDAPGPLMAFKIVEIRAERL
jgi:hypothetical protein